MIKKVLVLGKGFLGKQFAQNGFTVWGRDELNIDPEDIKGSISNTLTPEVFVKYDAIINCIGNANTRECEDPDYWESVYTINAELPRELSKLCKANNTKFVQISSGCVYDQNNKPQTEESYVSSHCRYVVSKLAGEFFCNSEDLILRPRLYFGENVDKNNLLCKIQNFEVFLTEINSYTSVQTIVESAIALIDADCSGVFNVAQSGVTNLARIGKFIGLNTEKHMSGEVLRHREGLYLVNNIMDTSKLEKYYTPRPLLSEVKSCWDILKIKLKGN